MTHGTSSCTTCDWCGEIEPEAGMWEAKDESVLREFTLCNTCNPDKDVDQGAFVVYQFTMNTEEQTVGELISKWIEASGISSEWKAIKNTGLDTSTHGHTRCKLVIEMKNKSHHYRMRNLISLKSVIDAANGDPERNNTRVNIYSYDVGEEVLDMNDPEVFAASEGHPELQSTDDSEDSEAYEEKLDKIRDSYELAKAMKDKLDEDNSPQFPLAKGADALKQARTDNQHTRTKKLLEAKVSWEHAVETFDNGALVSTVEDELIDEVSEVIEKHTQE